MTGLAAALAAVALAACGGSSGEDEATSDALRRRIAVSVSPTTAALSTGGTQQFTAKVTSTTNVAVAWSVEEGSAGGTVTSTGLYTAPAIAGTYHVVATSVANSSRSGAATVSVTAPAPVVAVTISPTSASLAAGATKQFAASVTGTTNAAVSWTVQEGVAGGGVSATGLYTAPTAAGTYHVVATSLVDSTKSAVATVTVAAPNAVAVAVSPAATTVAPGSTQQFSVTVTGTSDGSVSWKVQEGPSGGTVSSTGLYTAPSTAGTYHVVATSVASTTSSGIATVTVGATGTAAPTAPLLLNTDIVAGSLTGGESNLGAYMSLFGLRLGTSAALGTGAGARVYFRNPSGDDAWHEVANYRAKINSRTYARNGVEQLIVQLGSLGGAANGAVLDVKVTVNGVDSNVLPGWFTVQPGRFFFASLSGNDSTGVVDDITHPFRYVQNSSSGIWASTVPTGAAGLRAGDTIVVRGGNWTDSVGNSGAWARFQTHTGSAPTGAVGHGYITITRYPGPILGDAPEDAHYTAPPSVIGGINGPGSSYESTGGKYVVVSGLRIDVASGNTNPDAAPVYLQNGGDHWRVVGNELGPWPTTGSANAGGICGEGANDMILFNYIHDIGGSTSAYQNHGIYADESGSGAHSNTWTIAYNWIRNIDAGSGFQFYASSGSGTFHDFKIHHNWLEHVAKNGLNLSDDIGAGNDVYDNVILDVKGASGGTSFKITTPTSGMAVNFVHNTVVQYQSSGAPILSDGGSSVGSGMTLNIQHNIVAMGPGRSSSLAFEDFSGGAGVHYAQNLWYDLEPSGRKTAPSTSIDPGRIAADPLFTRDPTSATSDDGDYSLQATSPARDAASTANPIGVATDLLSAPRPVPDTSTPGASKDDLGAFEYVAP